jgi:F-type H+-transporting ATPase subunit gamma
MPSLKSLRLRIQSVVATRKITSAMKMVAASKLRRAQDQTETARPYASGIMNLVNELHSAACDMDEVPLLLKQPDHDHVHLIIVATSDRGLCGNFNSSIVRFTRRHISSLLNQGKEVKMITVGRKGKEQLQRFYGHFMIDHKEGLGKPKLTFKNAEDLAQDILKRFEQKEFDQCTFIYNAFKSAIQSEVKALPLVPVATPYVDYHANQNGNGKILTLHHFEPSPQKVLENLLPRMLAVQVYGALLDNAASEHASRMTAMDSATRNAGEMIDRLKIYYNRTRQSYITRELIEIVSGAEAL